MIARIWQAKTRPGLGDSYQSYLEKTGLKDYRATPGLKQLLVLRRELGDQTEYLLITLWEDMEAIKRFAGANPELAVYYPEDEEFLAPGELRPEVVHFDVISN
jgi:heme-degrading monooxygenase HmoA